MTVVFPHHLDGEVHLKQFCRKNLERFLKCLKDSKHTVLFCFVFEKNVSREHYSLGDEISCLFNQAALLRSSAFHEISYVNSLTF